MNGISAGSPRTLPVAATAAWLSAGALLAGLLAGCGGNSPSPANSITVNTATCGGQWSPVAPGWHTFHIQNQSTEAAEVDLIDPASGAIYAELEASGPNTVNPLQVDVGSGSYAFRCLLEDTDPVTGPTVRIPGHVRGAAAILPVTTDDLIQPAREYRTYVTAGLNVLLAQVKKLAAGIGSGNLAAARAAWLPAHLTYERLGAAYDSFGNFDGEIDGRATGLAGGVSSPQFTGFYRLEYGLWHGQSARQLTGLGNHLVKDVAALRAAWPGMEIGLLDIGLRTNEILENALEFQLTGTDDYGSGTTLATVGANITGTRELLQILHPLLAARYTGLPSVYSWLDRLEGLITAQHHRSGSWTPMSQLSTGDRQMINATLSQTLQELAPIAVITEPRRT
ncbi:MAG TPA: EfeM/EfeO family lipoprotein [Streptosporangiaceae bacterium]